jgi:anti-anti-sigma factor
MTGEAHKDDWQLVASQASVLARQNGQETVIHLAGEFDLACAGQLGETLDRICSKAAVSLLLDLSMVSFIDCAGWRPVRDVARALAHQGRGIEIVAVSAPAHSFLGMVGLDEGVSWSPGEQL